MTVNLEQDLAEMGLSLPQPMTPQGLYTPYVITGSTVYISGQLPMQDGKLAMTGTLGDTVSIEQGAEAAKLCALQLLAQAVAAAGGDAARIERFVKLTGFVASTPAFTAQPQVVNGASQLIIDLFGDVGRHARSAVGVAALPLGAPVEVEAVLTLK